MIDFYCNKRFDISFSDFHRLIRVILPSELTSKETRGIYKRDYMPCNIIELTNVSNEHVGNIYCWLGQKGLTVLADNALTVSLCLEATKEIKQNPEDFKVLSYQTIDETKLTNKLMTEQTIRLYKQLNASEKTSKYIIKENNGDEVLLDFYYDPDSVRLSGAITSLFTLVQLSIENLLNQ